jgi:hypothetical protein
MSEPVRHAISILADGRRPTQSEMTAAFEAILAGEAEPALMAAFPGREAFAVDRFGKGDSVDQAKDAFRDVRLAELDYLAGSVAARTTLAENYVGLPYAA